MCEECRLKLTREGALHFKDEQDWMIKIDAMSHYDMAVLHRFSPSGHPCFNMKNAISSYFSEKFKLLGGMTPEISKRVGW